MSNKSSRERSFSFVVVNYCNLVLFGSCFDDVEEDESR